jgi:hypothetical protein
LVSPPANLIRPERGIHAASAGFAHY